jgi:phosphoenolpyruvate synthase/pyruvate phosphate dikinase
MDNIKLILAFKKQVIEWRLEEVDAEIFMIQSRKRLLESELRDVEKELNGE